MKGVIIYKSKYGSTRQYAEWLHGETGFDLFDVRQSPPDFQQYDTLIIGSSVFAGRLALANWIRQHWPSLCGKTVLVMMVNITADQNMVANFVPQSLPGEIADHLKVFPVGGRYSLQQMSFFDRTMIKMVASLEKRQEVKQELLAERDWVNKDNLQALLDEIHRLPVGTDSRTSTVSDT
ncbi:MAG TPA: flavodoxin domain-containing protein [Armatimonadota bacterium]|nr:flavodoxin domain-containing protein [Armatimonadota bacterium]